MRRVVYNFILKYPGVYLREISRETMIPKSTIEYHLRYLKKMDLIVAKNGDRYTRYYVSGKIGREHKKALSILRKKTPLHIALFLSMCHVSTRKELCHDLEKSASTISLHLNKLIERDIVEKFHDGNMVKYRLKDEKATDKILIQYKESLLDRWVIFFFDYVDFVRADKSLLRFMFWLGKNEDTFEKLLNDVFPHPYHA